MPAARAAAGESTIYRDDTGRWHGYVSLGSKSGGRRDRRHVSGVRRADVVRKVRELEAKRDAGVAEAAGRAPTLSAWLEHWLDNIAARKVRPSTLTRYRQLVAHQITPMLGHHRLDRLQPEHVEEMYGQLLDAGLAPNTVLQVHRVLSRALKVAMQRGRVARNVCTLVQAPSANRPDVQPLDRDEARAVLAVAAQRRNRARWTVALALGARQGEALGLPWDDVDLTAGTLTIRWALQRRPWQHGCGKPPACGCTPRRCPKRTGGGLVYVDPKSRAGRRTVTLPRPLLDELRAHRSAQAAERLAAGSTWQLQPRGGLVFAQADGRPIDLRSDHREWQQILALAGVAPHRLHDARHTAATLLLEQGVDIKVVAEIIGHSQTSLTRDTYQHVTKRLHEDAAARMAAALWE